MDATALVGWERDRRRLQCSPFRNNLGSNQSYVSAPSLTRVLVFSTRDPSPNPLACRNLPFALRIQPLPARPCAKSHLRLIFKYDLNSRSFIRL